MQEEVTLELHFLCYHWANNNNNNNYNINNNNINDNLIFLDNSRSL